MAKFARKGKTLKKEVKRRSRKDDKFFFSNIGVLIVSILLCGLLESVIPIVIWIIFRFYINKDWKRAIRDAEIGSAGLYGESITEKVLKKLPNSYYIFSDFTIEVKGKESQIDHAVIGPNGVFVVETKYWSGEIIESENENRVIQVTKNSGLHREHYHPSKQVGTHVYRLSTLLKENGLKTWVNGCVFFSHNEVKVNGKHETYPLFEQTDELLNYLTKNGSNNLSKEEIEKIIRVIDKSCK